MRLLLTPVQHRAIIRRAMRLRVSNWPSSSFHLVAAVAVCWSTYSWNVSTDPLHAMATWEWVGMFAPALVVWGLWPRV